MIWGGGQVFYWDCLHLSCSSLTKDRQPYIEDEGYAYLEGSSAQKFCLVEDQRIPGEPNIP